MIAAALLISTGKASETGWEHLHQARGCPVPDTEEQRDWVQIFAVRLVKVMKRGA
jgi:hypothetical protein